ncbi:glycosyltransferase family 2 protein [Bacteroides sp. GD17]|jgi:glycosyltransferase involved in cell wall biosynthesis|uniref:glycosyltransferase family 2 protein n=1 Tax=Bacteroides sp. GD17 TaxID=3139826 RepID=UPI00313DFDAA
MVSIIIPIYNVESYIEASFYSALNQTYQNIEFILVDDCGTDKSMEIVCKMVENSTRKEQIRIEHHTHNKGLSAARNTGMRVAKGDYLFFMDSDDEIRPDCIALHVQAMEQKQSDFTVGNIQLEGAKSLHINVIDSTINTTVPFKSFLQRKWLCSACNKLYKRTWLEQYAFTFREGMIFEDVLWCYQLSQKCGAISVVSQPTYIYKIRSNSTTTQPNSSKKIESMLLLFRIFDSDLKEGKIPLQHLGAFKCYFDFYRLNAALLLLNFDGSKEECRSYYKQIQLFDTKNLSLNSLILRLPYLLFMILLKPIYLGYKYFVSVQK